MAKIAIEDVVIRVLKPNDIEQVVDIDEKVSGERRKEYYERKFASVLDKERQIVTSLVAEFDNKIIGFIMGEVLLGEFGIPAATATIDTIGVDPEYQGSGVGKALMEEYLSNLRKAGVETVYTFVNWNDWGLLKFFESAGFKPGRMINLEIKL